MCLDHFCSGGLMLNRVRSNRGLIFVALICALSIFVQTALAQGTADIVGTVTDNSGAVLPNAKVTVKSLDTNLERSLQTSGSGDYSFTLLPVGNYSVTVEAQGFKMFSNPRVTVATGER